jgi:hypothetical protein
MTFIVLSGEPALAKPVDAPKVVETPKSPIGVKAQRRTKSVLQVNVPYTSIEFHTDQPLASAKGGLIALSVKYTGSGQTASVQVPGSVSYPVGPFSGAFEHTVDAADVRALLRRDEAAILTRCQNTLQANNAQSINTVHDTTLPFIVAAADGSSLASTSVSYQLGLLCVAPPPPLQVTVPFTRIEVVTGERLQVAKGGLVNLGLSYHGTGSVASLQVPGALSYPLGKHVGSFDTSVNNADVRALLANDDAAIQSRCAGTLDTNHAQQIDTVHDTRVHFTVNGATGNVVAETDVAYQLGLTCKRPLSATIGYTKITVNPSKPLAQATGGLVPLSVTYAGSSATASVQIPGALSYPLGTHTGAFQQTISNADIRAILAADEAAILKRCKDTLDFNHASTIDTVHDAQITVTVNASDGHVVATTSVAYQLGLTCVL